MKKILIIIVAIGLLYKFNPGLFGFLNEKKGAFNSDGSPKAILFVHGDCGTPCNNALSYAEKKDVAIDIIDVKNNEQGDKEFKRYSKRNRVPVLVVGKNIYYGFHNQRYNEVLYDAFGDSALDWQQKRVFKHHFYEDGSPKLVMYGVSWCGYCAKARDKFVELGVEYVEWDVEQDSRAKGRFEVLQGSGYPLIYIGTRRIGSFDERKIVESLKEYMVLTSE